MKNGVGNCMDDKEKDRYRESVKQYLREMKMMEAINNNDLEYTKFGNSNQKIGLKDGKPGKAYSEEIDGIKIPLKSGMAITTNLKLRDKRVISLVSDLLVDQTDSVRSLRQQ